MLEPLLTKEQYERSAMQSVIRMGTRKTFEDKLCRTIYAFAMDEKVKRVKLFLSMEIIITTTIPSAKVIITKRMERRYYWFHLM